MKSSNELLSPVLYIPHGAGPLPLLGDKNHESLIAFLKRISESIRVPSAILVISAHWEERQATITSGSHPKIIYDYSGFPPQAYDVQYPAIGNPKLAREIFDLIEREEIDVRLDERRGFDHGMYVPLKLLYPDAKIPCLQVSLLRNLLPAEHIELGKSLASLRRKNVLIIGSGLSYHNLGVFFRPEIDSHKKSVAFDHWLADTCTDTTLSVSERENRFVTWEKAPFARHCHPREEHLLPLHVCFGVANVETPTASVIFNEDFMGARITALQW